MPSRYVGSRVSIRGSPLRVHSGGLASDRKQADLKPLMELEVSGLVFQHAEVPYLFFPRVPGLMTRVPKLEDQTVTQLLAEMDLYAKDAERDFYVPLVALFNYISEKVFQGNSTNASPRLFFFVYDKQMADAKDGAGKLMPDVLGSEINFGAEDRVPWIAVRIAVEVKNTWSSAIQQALTYARSMLEVGDKWFALVIVFRQDVRRVCFCFATRQGVYLSPKYTLMTGKKDEFRAFASALMHACYYSGSQAGIDELRSFDSSGQLHFNIPGLGLLRSEEIFHRIQIIGRATHVYRVQPHGYESFAPSQAAVPGDPLGLTDKLLEAGDELVHLTDMEMVDPPSKVERPQTMVAVSDDDEPESPLAGLPRPHVSPAAPSRPPPRVGASETKPRPQPIFSPSSSMGTITEDWETLCKRGSGPYWVNGSKTKEALMRAGNPSIIKSTWALYGRRNAELEALQVLTGEYAIVDYAGYMVVPHPGMEKLSFFQGKNPSQFQDPEWERVYPEMKPPVFVQRIHKLLFQNTPGQSIETLGDDPELTAHAFKDVVTALFIVFKHGFSHRDVSTGNVQRLEKPIIRDEAQLTALLGKFLGPRLREFMPLFTRQYAFLCDFDHAVKWAEERVYAHGRSGTWGFLPAARMALLSNGVREWDDGPIDDFESLVVVMFYNTLRANLKDASSIEQRHFASFHSDDAYHLCATKHMFLGFPSNAPHLRALKKTWPLWWRLFEVASRARMELNLIRKDLRGKTFASGSAEAHRQLHRVTDEAYFGYLTAVQEAFADPAWGK